MPAVSFIDDGPQSRNKKIKDTILELFRGEALLQEPAIIEPISEEQIRAWLRFVVPQIEEAYGVRVYGALEAELSRAVGEVERIFGLLEGKPDKVLGYISTGIRSNNGAQ
ncbi:hypothetical protein HOY80DRAFT_330588 [Tuber brumale]|nr:hypothetical protein HOY80DRAFT_330588 [Tuber brumale]